MSSKLVAIDLFSGAGGLSLGFEQVGFSVPMALEIDIWATETFKGNRSNCNVIKADITELSDSFFKDYKGADVVMGGPPCQGFSISASNRRNPDDPRNFLYRDFLRAVKVIKPRGFLLENVKEIFKARIPSGDLILNDFSKILSKLGYSFFYSLLNTADFGIPQSRVRFFLVAGIKGTPDIKSNKSFGVESPLFPKSQPYYSSWEAISDLPSVIPRKYKENDTLSYKKEPQNDYQRQLRKGSTIIYNHIPMRHTDRTIEKFKLISIRGRKTNIPKEFSSRKRGDPSKFSKVIYDQNHRRLNPNKPSPTITASFYSSFIHPFANRNLTVREAARIQSFPDKYRFYGKRTTLSKKLLARKGIYEDMHLDQFNQVGNAVPPLLANSLARSISDFLLGRRHK